MLRAPLLAAAASFALFTPPALAQTADAAAQRQVVFQQMLSDPSNRQLMREYARLSVEMRDFEAAAATLERLVDLEPNNIPARVELAVAYFALGSYAVAEYHLAAVQTSGTLTPVQAAQVARYREEAQERDDGSDYSGRLEVGYAWTDTASEGGAFANGAIDWRVDLGDADVTQWVTEFAFTSYEPGDDSVNGRTNGRLRTGPEFRLSRDAYGPRLQPYVEFGWLTNDVDFDQDFNSWAIGVAYANPINERFTVYADATVGREYAMNGSFGDFDFHEFDLGATYRPSRDTRFRLSGTLGERRQRDTGFPLTTTEASVRLSAQHAFDPAFQTLPNRWVVGAFAESSQRTIEDDFFTDTEIDRQSYGAWLRAFVIEDIYVEVGASQVSEDSTFLFAAPTSREEMIYTFQIGWEF